VNVLKFLNRSANLDPIKIYKDVLKESDVQSFIISLNTNDQLFDLGVDATGKLFADIRQPYSDSTIKKKRREGLPTNRVTLFDTGKFHESFRTEVKNDGTVLIKSDSNVNSGYDLEDSYGENIAGLTKESLEKLREFLLPKIIASFKAEIFRGL
jgi:hypothetical protein